MKSTVKKISTEIEHFPIPILVLVTLIFPLWCGPCLAFADQEQLQGIRSEPNGAAVKKTDEEYHTPLAGEPFHLEFMGRSIDIPARDRGNVSSLEIGGAVYVPDITDTTVIPMFALYMRRTWERARLRIVASGIENEVDGSGCADKRFSLEFSNLYRICMGYRFSP